MKRVFFNVGMVFIFSLFVLNFLPRRMVYIIIVLCAFSLAFLIKSLKYDRQNSIVFITAIVSFLLATVVFYVHIHQKISPIQKILNKDLIITAKICDIPYKLDEKIYYAVETVSIDGYISVSKNTKLSLIAHGPIDADYFDIVKMKIHVFDNEALDFGNATYLRSKGIFAQGYVFEHEEILVKKSPHKTFRYYILKFRENLILKNKIFYGEELSDFTDAFLLSQKHNLYSTKKAETLKEAGVYHLVGTCGMYLAIIIQIIVKALRKLKLNEMFIAFFGIFVTILFTTFFGISSTIFRTSIMLIISLFGKFISRNSDSLNSLGFAVFLIGLINPDVVFDIGFLLSFSTSLGIKVISNKKFTNFSNKILHYLVKNAVTSMSIVIFTLPIVCIFIRKISLISPISELILFPLGTSIFSLTLVTNLLGIFLNTIWLRWLINSNIALIRIFLKTAVFFGNIPHNSISLATPYIKLWVSFSIILLALSIIICDDFAKNLRLSILISINLLIIGIFSHSVAMNNVCRIAIPNICDGTVLLLSFGKHRAIIISPEDHTNYYRIFDYISKNDIKKLDLLVLPGYSESEEANLKNFIEGIDIKLLISHIDNKFLHGKLVYFDKNIKLSFWNKIHLNIQRENKKYFIKITVDNKKIVIIPNGGDTNTTPDHLKTCNILVTNGLPNHFNRILTNVILAVGNKEDQEIIVKKLKKSRQNHYFIMRNSGIFIDFKNLNQVAIRKEL